MKKLTLSSLILLALSGCTSMPVDNALVLLQADTARTLGLASSEELTLSEVEVTEMDMEQKRVDYLATTTQGRQLRCRATIMPGFLTTPSHLNEPKCMAENAQGSDAAPIKYTVHEKENNEEKEQSAICASKPQGC